ncbi:type 1 glutamine amidotransferase domain-containing protein [Halanaerobacter jeridensis]|uniref:Protease I n=1 Tax=Halanaerobacter jeridensis TaxID=706427 RepID=A0A939BMX7_9FIRM|nr:type 1 glutamine amidotransferase domain-containing protein [Halanaerobacter jeridensis]MBM7557735.1 protease I [Halanaerobacter jeridensis]
MKLVDKKIAMLAGPKYEDLEFWVVYMRMIEEGADVTIVGPTEGTEYTSKSDGLTVEVEAAASDVDSSEFDAVLVPGGWAPDKIRRDEGVVDLVREIYEQDKIVGMICHAGLVGISAGIVEGSEATGSQGIKDDLVNAGAKWVDQAAVKDGNLVWGRVVKDIPDYCRVLIGALQ